MLRLTLIGSDGEPGERENLLRHIWLRGLAAAGGRAIGALG